MDFIESFLLVGLYFLSVPAKSSETRHVPVFKNKHPVFKIQVLDVNTRIVYRSSGYRTTDAVVCWATGQQMALVLFLQTMCDDIPHSLLAITKALSVFKGRFL